MPLACDLQAVLMFPQHPVCVYYASNPYKMESIAFIKQL